MFGSDRVPHFTLRVRVFAPHECGDEAGAAERASRRDRDPDTRDK